MKNKKIILSANTYKTNGDNYTKPYIIKKIETDEGTIKLGILGLTIKEVDDEGSGELKDLIGYENKLYMNDLVKDAKKWTKVMKEKADAIVAGHTHVAFEQHDYKNKNGKWKVIDKKSSIVNFE